MNLYQKVQHTYWLTCLSMPSSCPISHHPNGHYIRSIVCISIWLLHGQVDINARNSMLVDIFN